MPSITLRAARINKGLTLKEASDRVGTTQKTLSNWERGETAISVVKFDALCELYGVNPDYVKTPLVKDGKFNDD